MLLINDSTDVKITDIKLVCHLIRTMEIKYKFNLDKMKEIYNELIKI